ncbi:sigma-70 family RNA polymerase sigma factor [Bacillus salacetis]|uniref:sigma-70 family RNA polymerase sigma factor n=1 Tax=Bacillus salacetis TaxID=2315464 RepID=UPI001F0C8F3D|nr:sigma-70 family RNA polymerase sigma factor [Bacillus salacetis]
MKDFNEVLEQYEPMIHKIISTLHIYKEKGEFYQIGMTALWEAWEKFEEGKGSFTGYAYTTIKGRCMDELRRQVKWKEGCAYPDGTDFWEMLPDDSVTGRLEAETLMTYFLPLTDPQKKWVLYTYIGMMNVREIAEREQVSVSAVKKWRSGAQARLVIGKQ